MQRTSEVMTTKTTGPGISKRSFSIGRLASTAPRGYSPFEKTLEGTALSVPTFPLKRSSIAAGRYGPMAAGSDPSCRTINGTDGALPSISERTLALAGGAEGGGGRTSARTRSHHSSFSENSRNPVNSIRSFSFFAISPGSGRVPCARHPSRRNLRNTPRRQHFPPDRVSRQPPRG